MAALVTAATVRLRVQPPPRWIGHGLPRPRQCRCGAGALLLSRLWPRRRRPRAACMQGVEASQHRTVEAPQRLREAVLCRRHVAEGR